MKTPRIAKVHGVKSPRVPDALQLGKRFFLYRNVFGNMGGGPKLGPMGGIGKPDPLIGLEPHPLGMPGSSGSIGGLAGLSVARRMGIL